MEFVNDMQSLNRKLLSAYEKHGKKTAFTAGISGIDAAGKGYTSKKLQESLEDLGYIVANINIDPWQNPLPVRLRKDNAAENIYENIFRWQQFFDQLIFPSQKNKSIYLKTEGIRSDADIYYTLVYDYKDIDFLFVEGILLFKKRFLLHYDFKIWIDCSFETGLKRAIQRNVENLDEARLIHDYDTYYYAAQQLHFERDDPQKAADVIFCNDLIMSKA